MYRAKVKAIAEAAIIGAERGEWYLDKNNLYNGDRPVLDIFTTVKLGTIYKLKVILPRGLTNFIRRLLKKCGKKFYSDEYEN